MVLCNADLQSENTVPFLTEIIVLIVNSIGLRILVLKFDLMLAAIRNGFERYSHVGVDNN